MTAEKYQAIQNIIMRDIEFADALDDLAENLDEGNLEEFRAVELMWLTAHSALLNLIANVDTSRSRK